MHADLQLRMHVQVFFILSGIGRAIVAIFASVDNSTELRPGEE